MHRRPVLATLTGTSSRRLRLQVWIVKPAAAYCGRGINLHRSSPELPEALLGQKGVASKYVDPPFLLDGLKSDIRIYVRERAGPGWRGTFTYIHV
jgi:hypothetical protein